MKTSWKYKKGGKLQIWSIENPFDLYDSKPEYKKAENAIKRALRSGKLTLKNLDRSEILEKYKDVGADDTAARDRIYMMLKGKRYEDVFKKGGKMKQGYNDRMDDSLGNRDGKSSKMKQTLKDRRSEAKGENKAVGNRAYASVGTMDIKLPDFFEKGGKIASVFDSLKKGDTVKITYGSSIRKDGKATLNVRSKSRVGKGKSYEAEKITFINEANPKGVKFYAYKRLNGYIGFAIGDLAISIDTIEKEMKKGGSTFIQNATEKMKKKGTVGAFTKEAKGARMSTEEFAKKVLSTPEKYSEKTRKRAQFMKNVNPEMFETGGSMYSGKPKISEKEDGFIVFYPSKSTMSGMIFWDEDISDWVDEEEYATKYSSRKMAEQAKSTEPKFESGGKMQTGGNVATSVRMFNSEFRELNSKGMNADGHLNKAKQVLKKIVPALEKLYKELWEKIHRFDFEGKDVKTLKLIAAKMNDSVQRYKGQLNFIEMYKQGGKTHTMPDGSKMLNSDHYAKGGSTYEGGGDIEDGNEVEDFIYGDDIAEYLTTEKYGTDWWDGENYKNEDVEAYYINIVDYAEGNKDNPYIDEDTAEMVDEIIKEEYAKGGSTYAEGGMIEHGLQIGDCVIKYDENSDITVMNKRKKYVVNLDSGKRVEISKKETGGQMKQGYNDRDDESLGMSHRGSMKYQSLKDRRNESKGERKSMGKRSYRDDK